jgi:eukaryotic-like serine/threonine-protein kinase
MDDAVARSFPMAAADADRHLLFGLIALQVGLIEQAQLVAAFQAWARDKSRPLADHLADHAGLDGDSRAAVEAMVALHVKKHGSDAEKSLAAIPAGRTTRERLAALGDPELTGTVARLASGSTDQVADCTVSYADNAASYAVGTVTSDGQRFRVLRPHARGGLGAVFVALDAELHREVALKQIVDSHADDPVSRRRFLLEAEITGGLEHPGIVPVYGLGTYADGRPYYAMRFIRGDSLKEAIEQFHKDLALKQDTGRRSLELRQLLRRFTDVCNAIDYAHSRGILHRDLKPGNIIIGKHGETLVVDWGLAKPLGRKNPDSDTGERTLMPSSISGSGETVRGKALGTPGYMSPEQARGDLNRLAPRSDVYSLGATLYCLLTGRPPFEGDEVASVLRKVQWGDFIAPRKINRAIDPALEAVCLKAMAFAPDDRYATSRALADDIERWTAGQAVSAWQEPLSRRVRRWARRSQTAVAALVGALLVALAGSVYVRNVQARADADRRSANARDKQQFNLAMDAINIFNGEVRSDPVFKEKPFDGLRTRLVTRAAEFYGRLEVLLHGRSDRESHAAIGDAYNELGGMLQSGSPNESIAYFEREEAVWTTLADTNPTVPDYTHSLARCQVNTATILLRLGRPDEARTRCERALALCESLVDDHPNVREYPRVLALGLIRLGQARHAAGDIVGASADWSRAVALVKKVTVPDGELIFIDAVSHASLSVLAGVPGTGVSAVDRDAQCDQAISSLGRAATLGYRDPDKYRTETGLDPLRGRDDFRLLMMDLVMPADPFTRGH